MEFADIIEKYRNIVDAEIGKFFDAKIAALQDDFLRESYGYLKEFVLGPGKRLRPVSMIMAFSAVNGSGGEKEEIAYPLSIVPEMVHCSTLIHDDLIDEDKIRVILDQLDLTSMRRAHVGQRAEQRLWV